MLENRVCLFEAKYVSLLSKWGKKVSLTETNEETERLNPGRFASLTFWILDALYLGCLVTGRFEFGRFEVERVESGRFASVPYKETYLLNGPFKGTEVWDF